MENKLTPEESDKIAVLLNGNHRLSDILDCVNKILSIRPAPISEELPDFLYRDGGNILIGYNGDSVVTDEWNRWQLGRQSRIVLPESTDTNDLRGIDYANADGWNACLESIRTLNPSAFFVTGQNEAK